MKKTQLVPETKEITPVESSEILETSKSKDRGSLGTAGQSNGQNPSQSGKPKFSKRRLLIRQPMVNISKRNAWLPCEIFTIGCRIRSRRFENFAFRFGWVLPVALPCGSEASPVF